MVGLGGGDGGHTTSIKISNSGPFHFFTSSVESYSAQSVLYSPKYPLKAFSPHGQLLGLAMGAYAETDLYFPGFFKNYTPITIAIPSANQPPLPSSSLS